MSEIQNEEMSLRDFLEVLLLRKRTILQVFFGVVLTAAFLCIFVLSPSYESSSKVLINTTNLVVPATQDIPPSESDKASSFATQKDMITSGVIANRVLDQLHLDQTRTLSRMERFSVWIKLSIRRPLGKAFGIKSWLQPIDYRALAANALASHLKVETKPDSQIVKVSYSAYSPDEATRTLDAILAVYRDDFNARVRGQAEGMTNYLEAQLDEVQTKLAASEEKLLALRKNDTVRLSKSSGNHQSGSESSAVDSGSILGASDNEIVQNELKTSILSMQEQLRNLLSQYTEHDPAVIALQSQIQHLSEALGNLPQRELSSSRLKRDLEVNQDAYLFLRKDLEHARIVAASNVGQINIISIVDPPSNSARAVSPNIPLTMVVAIIFGLAFGIVLAWFQNLSDHSLRNAGELQRYLGLRVIASLPEL